MARSGELDDECGGVVLTGSKTRRIGRRASRIALSDFASRVDSRSGSSSIRSRPHAVTPNLVSKATAPLPILSLACEAASGWAPRAW